MSCLRRRWEKGVKIEYVGHLGTVVKFQLRTSFGRSQASLLLQWDSNNFESDWKENDSRRKVRAGSAVWTHERRWHLLFITSKDGIDQNLESFKEQKFELSLSLWLEGTSKLKHHASQDSWRSTPQRWEHLESRRWYAGVNPVVQSGCQKEYLVSNEVVLKTEWWETLLNSGEQEMHPAVKRALFSWLVSAYQDLRWVSSWR